MNKETTDYVNYPSLEEVFKSFDKTKELLIELVIEKESRIKQLEKELEEYKNDK